MSGTTSYEILNQYRNENINAEAIYFFVHSNAYPFEDNPLPMSLLFWARNEIIEQINDKKNVEGYKRVGKSPIIAKDGYKFFKIPRYDSRKESVYFRTPKESYNDWQSSIDSIIKVGNYEYGNSVDLIKIDLLRALSISFERPNERELVKYLLNHFYYAFFGENDVLSNNTSFEKLNFEIRKFIKDPDNKTFFEKVSLVVYPAHLNTNYAIKKVIEVFEQILKPQSFIEIKHNLVALPTIKKGKGASPYLFSPLIIGQIKDKINENSGMPNVLLFDCTIISGVTRKEIKHLLLTLGAGDVKSFSIIDRNCLSIESPNRDRRRSFWRLDIPRLSSKENNPISNSIKKLFDEKDYYHEEVKNRILEWEKYWGTKQYYYSDLETGLPEAQSIKINFELADDETDSATVNSKNKVRFSVDEKSQIGGAENRLLLKNSNGLSIYLTEIMSMTGREDLLFTDYFYTNKKNRHEINTYAWIEIIATQLLLFRSDLPPQSQYNLMEQLFYKCNSIKFPETNNYSALAAITLIGQSKSNLQKLWDKVISKYEDSEIMDLNIDLHLFIAYSLAHIINVSEDSFVSKYFSRFRISSKDLYIYKYEKLIYEFIEGVADKMPKHEKRISNFDNTKIDKKTLKLLSKELTIFKRFLSEIPLENLTYEYSDKNVDELCSLMSEAVKTIEELITNFSNRDSLENNKIELTNLMTQIQEALKAYISNFGIPIKTESTPSQQSSELKKYFEEVLKDTQQIKIGLIEPFPESWNKHDVWIIFDSFIRKEIEDYLLNLKHIEENCAIINPFQIDSQDAKALLWIRIHWANNYSFDNQKYIKIEFVNLVQQDKCSSTFKELKQRFPKQAKFLEENLKCRAEICEKSILEFKYIDKSFLLTHKTLSVSLFIPYII